MSLALVLVVLAACGGGGGEPEAPIEPTPLPDPPAQLDPIPEGAHAFHAKIDPRWLNAAHVKSVAGGEIQRGWNLADVRRTMTPGMKVLFFGRSPECGADISDGPVVPGADTEFETVRTRTGVPGIATTPDVRWTPSATAPGCGAVPEERSGPNWIYLDPQQDGELAVYTAVGPDGSGQPPFLKATPASGTDGKGYNANGIATFVAFRHDWSSASAVRPWLDAKGELVEARIVARQRVGAMETGPATPGVTSQVKQQVMFTVINTTCQRASPPGAGCHVQYLFNTAAARAGVTNWERFSPSQEAHLWLDKDQGGLPIIDGQVPSRGKTALERATKLPLYRSFGSESAHSAFSEQVFDIRISFDELLNAVRAFTARNLQISVEAVTEDNIASVWGPDWNVPNRWTLLSTDFGQEIHNSEFETRPAWIGGGFKEIYAGPAR